MISVVGVLKTKYMYIPPLPVVGAWATGCRVVGGEGWPPRPLSEPLDAWGRGGGGVTSRFGGLLRHGMELAISFDY